MTRVLCVNFRTLENQKTVSLPPLRGLCTTRRLSVCLSICLLPTSPKNADWNFMKILQEMHLRTRQF